jgi:hypothetical protein
LLGDPELPAGVEHGQAFAGVELNRSQMLNNLFGRIPFLGHDPDLPGCGPVSHSPWTKFARAGQSLRRAEAFLSYLNVWHGDHVLVLSLNSLDRQLAKSSILAPTIQEV